MTRVFARLVLLPKNVSSVLSPRDRKALTCVLTAAFFGSSSRKNPNQNHVWRRKEQGQKGVAGPKGGNDTRKLGAPPVPRVYQEHDSGRRSGVQVPLLSGTLPKRGRISEGEKKPRKTKRRTRRARRTRKDKRGRGHPWRPGTLHSDAQATGCRLHAPQRTPGGRLAPGRVLSAVLFLLVCSKSKFRKIWLLATCGPHCQFGQMPVSLTDARQEARANNWSMMGLYLVQLIVSTRAVKVEVVCQHTCNVVVCVSLF